MTSPESPPPSDRPPARGGLLPPILFALALALAGWIAWRTIGTAVRDPTSDDGYYLRYLQAIRAKGLAGFPALFEQWNRTPRDWIFPSPLRIGFIVVSALWGSLFGESYDSLQSLSFASFLLLAVVNYLFARRHAGEPRAMFFGALMAFSPLLAGIARLALADSFAALCMTTTVWLFFGVLRDSASLPGRVLFMAALAFTVLSKEHSVLLVVPFLAALLYERFALGIPHPPGRFALCFAIPGILCAAAFVAAAGSPARFLETTRIILESPKTNPYAIAYGSGPWFRSILDHMLFSPWPTLLAIAWFGVTCVRISTGEADRLSAYLAWVAAGMVLLFSFFTKNARYTVVLELPIRMFAVMFLAALAARWRPALAWGAVALAIAVFCWLDWRTFALFWERNRIYDPVTFYLVMVLHLIPRHLVGP